MKKTKWYPPELEPVRIGVYRTKHIDLGKGWSHWDGERFSNQYQTKGEAETYKHGSGINGKQWRGLARNPE